MSKHPISLTLGQSRPNLPDSDLRHCQALVIDTNQASRSLLRSMLSDLGLQNIVQAAKISDARRALETRTFDVVICDYHFDGSDMTGADLLDDMRRAQLLPLSTVFVMVTAEASYVKVAEAAESALDSYLIKPHTANALAERLHLARHRKVVLGPIFEAIEQEQYELAMQRCLQRFHDRGEYWVYAARLGGELLLRLERHDDARKLFEALSETKALPWAKLGIARAQLDGGHPKPARNTLESLLSENPGFADAWDVMGRAQLQSGDFESALETYKQAVALTPASISRLQKAGMLAFYLGHTEEANRVLEKATSLGLSSKMYDHQSLVMLAMLRLAERDARGLLRCLNDLGHAVMKRPYEPRLQRMKLLVEAMDMALNQRPDEVTRILGSMSREFTWPDFDFEAASNVLSLLARLHEMGMALPEADEWIRLIALRFCTSKASSDMLAITAQAAEEHARLIVQTYQTITDTAEKALTHAKSVSAAEAIRSLLASGSQTGNAKLLDLSDMMMNRYRADIPEAEALAEQITALREQYCRHVLHVQLGSTTGRQAGGLNLRK